MFRKGGSAGEGITSGLAPRQGYDEAGSVNQNDLEGVGVGVLVLVLLGVCVFEGVEW